MGQTGGGDEQIVGVDQESHESNSNGGTDAFSAANSASHRTASSAVSRGRSRQCVANVAPVAGPGWAAMALSRVGGKDWH